MAAPLPADLEDLLRRWVEGSVDALSGHFVGAYLQGSFALRSADADSDVDFVVVVERRLQREEVARLQEVHARVHDLPNRWAKRLEGSYVPAPVLRTLERRSERLWYLDHGARDLIPSTHCNTAVVRQTLRVHGIPLSGPSPATLVEEVPPDLLRQEMRRTMRHWGVAVLADDAPPSCWEQGFTVLSFCRMWCDITNGDVGTKQRGAAFAKPRLDQACSDLIDRAWATRHDAERMARTPADTRDWDMTRGLVQVITRECQAR